MLLLLLCLITATASFAQNTEWNHSKEDSVLTKDTFTKAPYTLVFINTDSMLDAIVKRELADAFFTVYPQEVNMYNPDAAKKVIFMIDTAYHGVAATGGGLVRFNPDWFHKHPDDIDVVTHEVMHIVQDYKNHAGPGWITEGIADYVRYKMGISNAAADWKLPDYNAKQNYDNSYRITARFFVWIEQHYDKTFVKQLDAAMRNKSYTDGFTVQHTGKTFAQLWDEYGKNPDIAM